MGKRAPATWWYMPTECDATRGGVQRASTCGLHAVNHATRAPMTWAAFDSLANEDERKPNGDWEYSALQRNVEAVGFGMAPVVTEMHEELTRWNEEANQLSMWTNECTGCILHVPGHWIALAKPAASSEAVAALLCDSLHPHPFALTAEELGSFFALIATRHQASELSAAAEWSAYIVQRPER